MPLASSHAVTARWKIRGQPRAAAGRSMRFVDSTLGAFLIENLCIIAIVAFRRLFRLHDIARCDARLWLDLVLGGLLIVEPMIATQWCLARRVYSHVPWFHPDSQSRAAKSAPLTLFFEWVRCNLTLHLFGSGVVASIVCHMMLPQRYDAIKAAGQEPLSVASFLVKLVVMRLVADVAFYVVHRVLHKWKFAFRWIHARHHEHVHPRIATNVHFTALDLLLEGFVPLFAGVRALNALGCVSSPLEFDLFTACVKRRSIAAIPINLS